MLVKALLPFFSETWPILVVFGFLLGGVYVKYKKDVFWAKAPVLATASVKTGEGWRTYDIVEFIGNNHIRVRNGETIELPNKLEDKNR